MKDFFQKKTFDFYDRYFQPLFFKVGALFCFCVAILVWIKILGFSNGTFDRIDLMPRYMQNFTISFAILYPITCSGLWQNSRWGKLLWGGVILLELYFFWSFPHHFPFTSLVLVIDILFIILYILGKISSFLFKKKFF